MEITMQRTEKGYRIGAAVFAGGHSVRMGSPKEEMVIKGDGRTFLDRICDEIDACTGTCISKRYLSVRRGQDITRKGYVTVEDEYEDIGPLGGLVSVLRAAEADGIDAVLIVAVDMIYYDMCEIKNICTSYKGEDILYARTEDGKIQPMAGIYSVRMLQNAARAANGGDHRIRAAEDEGTGIGYYDTPNSKAYLNINTPEDILSISG